MQIFIDLLESKISQHEKEIENSATIIDNTKIDKKDPEKAKLLMMTKDKIMFHKGSIAALEDIVEILSKVLSGDNKNVNSKTSI